MAWIWPWEKPAPIRYRPSRPDGFNDRLQFFNERPQAPVNDPNPAPLVKTLETVPGGERREVFSLTGAGTFSIFQNNTPISVEVNEVFIICIAVGSVQILIDEQPQTPVIPLISVDQIYSDSGFRLPINGIVFLTLVAGTKVSGFLRWRYT